MRMEAEFALIKSQHLENTLKFFLTTKTKKQPRPLRTQKIDEQNSTENFKDLWVYV